MLTSLIASLLMTAPAEWQCYEGLYADGYTCDCGCGIVDPDCGDQPVDRALCNNNFCPAGEVPMLGAPAICVPNECGDGFVAKGENCDDGDGEGCDEFCQIVTPGYRCSGLGAGCSVPRCGDRAVDFDRGEHCDDGNEDPGDGCDEDCQPEPGYICHVFGGCWPTLCGDGMIDFDYETQSGESCEDGGVDPGDGCDEHCRSEPGWVCRFDGCVPTVCGDGIVARGDFGGGEQCDDRGTKPGDGCDENCQVEPGWVCDDFQGCYEIRCGDSILAPGNETCDDGDDDPGDGCDEHCQAEPGWNCYYQAGECHQVVCGDNVVEGDQFGTVYEECDDGNTDSDDGCSKDCKGEPGWVCNKEGCHQIVCGDGHLDSQGGGGGPKPVDKVIIGPGGGGGDPGAPEQCDDGNTDSADGCDSFCQIEPGYVCPAPGEACVLPVCGDSSIDGEETCDDGNSDDGDGCSQRCLREPDWVCRVPGSPCEKMPTAWVCSLFIYGAGDGCDCGCGAVDPDCPKPLTVGACEFAHCLEGEPYPSVEDPTTCSKEPPPVVEPEPEPAPEVGPEPTPEPEPEVDTVEPAPDSGAEIAEGAVGGGRSNDGCNGGGAPLVLTLAALPLVVGARRRR
ncbi:MAG: DUF4215 domain-containing protein [Myxococcota bacterium]